MFNRLASVVFAGLCAVFFASPFLACDKFDMPPPVSAPLPPAAPSPIGEVVLVRIADAVPFDHPIDAPAITLFVDPLDPKERFLRVLWPLSRGASYRDLQGGTEVGWFTQTPVGTIRAGSWRPR